MAESRTTFDIAPRAIVKVLATIVLVWVWLQLWQLVTLIVVSIVLAVAVEPVVAWLERRRVHRSAAAVGVVLVLAFLIVGFFLITGSSLIGQAHLLGSRLEETNRWVIGHLPPFVAQVVKTDHVTSPDASVLASYVVSAGRLVTGAIVLGALALILTIYFLVEGRTTYEWMVAYVPREKRDRVHITAREARKATLAYVVGNAATSAFATTFTLIWLSVLHVPAALLLALLAGVFDFVPVLGFICSSVPAVLLALTVSPVVALAVLAIYASYHVIENYYIGPKIYGDRLRLSNLAVILAFAVGAELGGIVGALLALPVAGMYSVVERVWLKEYLARDAVETHRRIEQRHA
jgi:predicted PurR-regulated permease PerM